MNNAQSKALRNQINRLARQLEAAKTKAEIRNIKLAIRAAEVQLTQG